MTIDELLVVRAVELRAFVLRHGSGLLRHETADDLVQGVRQRALQARVEVRSEAESMAWLLAVARHFLADRVDYWAARRRGSARLVRLTSGGADPDAMPLPATASHGPLTVAMRREMLTLALRALAALPERDGRLVRWASEGVPLAEQAQRLALSYEATQRAAHRALDRFRKTYALAERRLGGGLSST